MRKLQKLLQVWEELPTLSVIVGSECKASELRHSCNGCSGCWRILYMTVHEVQLCQGCAVPQHTWAAICWLKLYVHAVHVQLLQLAWQAAYVWRVIQV